MRILKRSIALLLFICMMFSTMPLEFMQSAFAEPLGVDSPSLGVAGKSNTSGGVYKGNQVGFRIQLSRDSNNFLNGTQDQREKVLNYYSNKWPNGYDYGSNTIFFTSHDMYEWLWDRLKPGNAANSGGNVAIYTPSASAPDAKLPVYNTLKDLVIQGSYTTNVNLATANKFKNYALQLYDAGTVKDLGDFGNNIWLWGNGDKITGAGFPTGTEALDVLSTIFAKSGDNYKVVENITKFVEGNSTGLFMKDPSQMTEREKFEVSAGYAGLLIYFYSVIASSDTPNRAGTSATFETGINDYLMNANTEEKPVTLVIDTALALVENPNYYYITPTIDMIQYMALTSETEVLTNEANQIVVENLNGINLDKKNDTKQLIKEMYQKAVNRVSFGEVYTGAEKGDTGKPIRFADYGFGNMASLKSHAIPWAHDAFFFETVSKGYKGVIENTKENIVTTEGYATSHFPGYLSFLRLDNSRDIYGFVIIGNHIATPEPTVSYWVEDEIIVPPSGCAAEVQPSTLPTITVNIEGNSALISSMNHRKNDVNFQGIRMKATVKRTEYRNGFDEGCKYAVVEHVDYLEQQLNRSLLGDELLHILSGNPIILEDKSLLTDDGTVQTFMKSELGTTSIRYVYDINIDLYIDKAEYYFGTPGSDTKERTPIVYTSSDGTKYNFAEFVIPQLTTDIPQPEDIEITKPSSVDTVEIINPSENENLAENNQMIKRHQFTSGGAQFAEIKNNAPLQEQYEVMAGVPSTEELYYSVGGNEFQVALVVQHWMNEHSRDRTYTVHFDGNVCEYNNQEKDKGDSWVGVTLPTAEGAVMSTTRLEHADTSDPEKSIEYPTGMSNGKNYGTLEVTATWTGTIKNDASPVSDSKSTNHGSVSVNPKCPAEVNQTDYLEAIAQANAWMKAMSDFSKTDMKWTAASDKVERTIIIDVMSTTGNPNTTQAHKDSGTGSTSYKNSNGNTLMTGSWSFEYENPKDTEASDTKTANCSSSGDPPVHSHGSATASATAQPDGEKPYKIVVTYKIEPHSICGPCCGHVMPELWDTWRQGMVFDFAKIAQVRLYKLDQGSVDGLKELIGVDTVFASVRSGNPTYFMNIAQMTEKKRYGQDIIPAHFDTTESTADNIEQKGLTASTLKDVFITYLGTGKTNTDTLDERHFRTLAQSSRAGRLRYTLADGQNTETITITEQGNGTGGTYTFDPNLISAPDQHDDVIYNVGQRSKNCDGMATTNNFGKQSSKNDKPAELTGHVNEWADGCLYTNIMEKTVQAGIPGCTTNTSAYSGYWDSKLYSATVDTQKFEENTLQTYTKNDIHYTKYKEDYNHHIVRPDVLSAVSTDMKKTAYNDAADERDTQTAEWQFFNKARRTKIVGHVISDFLILQTSGGDQSIFYYEKESEPTEAQEHFQKVIIEPEELFYNNPLSIFIGDTACKEGEGAKQQYTKDFIVVGGYNGQYNEVDDKYRPYNMQDGEFKKFYDEGWYVYNATEHRDESGNYATTGYLGNTEIKTIFDDDPAKTIKRPERQAKNQGSSFKVYQDNLQILPTNPNKLYTPGESKVFYSQVLGYYSIDRDVIDARDRSNIIGTIGNVSIGWPQQEKHGEYYKKYWGSGNGVDYTTKYFMLPMKDRLSGDVFSTATDSGSTTVNPVIVYTPVSTEDAIVMELDDFEFDVNGVKTKVSRDQRVNNFEYPNMNDLVNALKVCPLDPELCEYRYLDCKFHEDTVLAEFDFEDTYVEKNIKRVKQADGSVKQEIVYGETLRNTYHNGTNWVTTDKVSGIEYMLPGGFNVGTYGKAGNTKELYANGTRWAIPLNSLGLSTNKSNMVEVEMDLTVDSTANNLMLASFYHYGFVLNPTNTLGSFIARSEEDSSRIGPRMDAKYSTALNKVKVKIKFGFNNVVDCEASINGVPANLTVSDLKKVWNDDDNDGVRTLDLRQVEVQDWINDAPRTFTVEDIGTNLIIGSWGSNDNYKANYYIDNLKITLKGGTTEHNSTCYERLTVHQTKRIHVHDEDCYLKEDMYTCTGELNGNYQLRDDFTSATGTKTWTSATNFTIPADGTYTIELYGEKGDDSSKAGGKGGHVKGTFTAIKGQILNISIATGGGSSGIQGGNAPVVKLDGTLIAIAGGGGGGSSCSSGYAGYNAGQWQTASGAAIAGSGYNGGGASGCGAGGGAGYQPGQGSDDHTGHGYYAGGGTNYVGGLNSVSINKGSDSNNQGDSTYTTATVILTYNIGPQGTPGLDYPNGDYTKPTIHIHNKIPQVLVCGRTENEVGGPINFAFTGSVQEETLPIGEYKLEVWGAQGGTYSSYAGGKGGYSTGILSITQPTKVYVNVGGTTTTTAGGWNGGGNANTNYTIGGGGGGGTDIRIGENSLYSRVIVAGGGGGAMYVAGGYGGGLSGATGYSGEVKTGSNRDGGAGGQTYGGVAWSQSSWVGLFGSAYNHPGTGYENGGGGGGWYGGAPGYDNDSDNDGRGGGGGSGYVYTSSTYDDYPSDCKLNSTYYLTSASTKAGNTSFTSPTGTSETGHSGDGYARITPISQPHTHTQDCYGVVTDSTSLKELVCEKPVGGDGQIRTYSTVGQTNVTLSAGRYRIEAWGAQGGDGTPHSNTGAAYTGGKGGYSVGEITLSTSKIIYIYIGGAGSTGKTASGGVNGGGQTGNASYDAGTGGGATHVGLKSGLLTNFSTDYSTQLLMVAGGGGGGGNNSIGGAGGGTSGVTPANSTQYDNRTPGSGGTQTSGYSFGQGQGRIGQNLAGGGGGGFYGGTQGANSTGGGGGSGYVNPNLLDSGTYNTIAGNTSFPNTAGTGNETGHSGNGYVKITNLDHQHTDACYRISNITVPEGYYAVQKCGKSETGGSNIDTTYNYESATYKTVTLDAGLYEIELYGAEGGYSSANSSVKGSKGTYVRGQLQLSSASTVYLYIGGQGVPGNSKTGGFNGGGTSGGCSCGSGSGGGATDIRIGGTAVGNRVMVAGGGGGAGTSSYPGYTTSKSNGTLLTGSTGNSSDGGGGGGGYHGGAGGSSVDIGGYIGTSYVNNTEYTTDVSTDTYEVKHNNNSGNGKIVIRSLGHTHTADCYDFIAIPKCDVIEEGELVCHGRLNATTDYNVHVHTADCLTTYAEIDTRMLRYTGDVQTFVVPYTDEYTFEAYGPEFEGRTAYSRATLSLKKDQVLYIYVGGTAGYNDYSTDIRVTPPPSGTAVPGEEAIWRDQWNQSLGTRVISAGNKEGSANTFVREYQNCTPINGYTGMRGGAGNGRVIITCKNTQLNPTIYQQIINGDMSHEDVKKYLGEPLYNKIMDGKEGLLHTWENWTVNNTLGFEEMNNVKLLYGGSSLICGKTENDPGTPIELDYTGRVEEVTLTSGEYLLEVWGAQGGTAAAGKGGYSKGNIILNTTTTLYIGVGGKGTQPTGYDANSGGWNGGGDAGSDNRGGGGGGATHIATVSGTLSSLESNKSKVLIVAGGGGGGSTQNGNGGVGGGTSGGNGDGCTTSSWGSYGGTQTEGGNTNVSTSYGCSLASFGQGGSWGPNASYGSQSGGGGGYYGGGAGVNGGGGSGYIGGVENGETKAGNTSFTSPAGTSETGHSGNGYARITPLKHTHTNECYGGGVGGYNCGLDENSEEIVGEFSYKGSEQNISLSAGRYKLEVWGAQGGSSESKIGGLGGYSVGELTLNSSDTLYINVGGQGGASSTAYGIGGYNGGGDGENHSSDKGVSAGGGGATHIGLKSGLLTTFSSDYTTQLLMVAGGGGGVGDWTDKDIAKLNGGYGGGEKAGDGETYASENRYGGKGATSTGIVQNTTGSYASENGSFGKGGSVPATSNTLVGGGGGGGLYGGGSGGGGGGAGGGGSGYVNTAKLTSATTIAGNVSFTSPTGTSEIGHSGNGYARITKLGHTHTEDCIGGTYICGKTESTLSTPIDFSYKNSVQSYTLPEGKYKLEVWGAQGGDNLSGAANKTGGKGGYSVGELTLTNATTVYVRTGGTPTSATIGGFNGGGSGSSTSGSAGGGGTDIRIGTDSLYARVIVAGGGGGGGKNHGDSISEIGGYGGGTTGGAGQCDSSGYNSSYNYNGKGGTQTSAGSNSSHSNTVASGGGFGVGYSNTYGSYANGGGGGWYGGGAGQFEAAGGGSGYVYTASTASNYPSGCELNSSYYLTNASTTAGNQSFLSPTGTSETGHSGNGYARITPLEGHKHTDACINKNVGGGGTATTLTCDIPVGGDGQVRTYGTVGASSVTLGAGRYRIEVWGAQGGNAASSNYTGGTGGKGGYSVGEVTLNQSTTYQIIVGGQGQSYNTNYSKLYGGNGGFGAGGAGGQPWMGATTSAGAGGGGLSGVFTSTSYTSSALIIAGGGGGGGGSAQGQSSNHGAGTNGGYGGGEIGGTGVHTLSGTTSVSHKSQNSGIGGTQSAGGAATNQNSVAGGKLYGGGGGGYTSGGSGNPTTLAGGVGSTSYNSSTSAGGSGGGGGGYYGGSGGGQYGLGGGGGSGYVNTSKLTSAQTIGGNTSFPNTAGTGNETGHSGNGFVKITSLDHQHTADCYTTVQIPDGYMLNCDITQGHVHSMENGCFVECVSEEGLTVISKGLDSHFKVPLGNIPVEAITKIVVYANNCPNSRARIYLKDDTGSFNEQDAVSSNNFEPNTENQVMTFMIQNNPNFSGEFTELRFDLADVVGTFTVSKIEVYGYGYKVEGTGDGSGNTSGTPINFGYTGTIQSVDLKAGTYKLEVWGAQGGDDTYRSTATSTGKYGGYSYGELTLNSADTLYVVVGGKGANTLSTTGNGNGYNGGGAPCGHSSGGGGATHIATKTGLLSSLSSYTSEILIVAGGGGGQDYGGTATQPNAAGYGGGGSQLPGAAYGNGKQATTTTGYSFGQGESSNSQTGSGGGGYYGGYRGNSANQVAYGGGGSAYLKSTLKNTGGSAGVWSGNGKAVITPLNTFTPLEITYVDPLDGCKTIIDANINLIPDKINGDYNPIWVCKFKEYNSHSCEMEDRNGNIIKLCKTHVLFNCTEPHHRGEHYSGSNRICWSACGDDTKHANTKKEVQINGETERLAQFVQLDAGFTVYFPNIGNFEGNNAHGLAATQITRGMGYTDNMDTTQWTREKRVKFPFEVIFDDKENGEMLIHERNTWIELDVETEFFNFYVLSSNPEMSNVRVQFEVEAINCGTSSGIKVKRDTSADRNKNNPYLMYYNSSSTTNVDNTVDKIYADKITDFQTEYINVLFNAVKSGYQVSYPNVGFGNSSTSGGFTEHGFMRFYESKKAGIETDLRTAMQTTDTRIEEDFEGTTRKYSDKIWPHTKSGDGINDNLKDITSNDNKKRVDNRMRSNSLESLHGGYKSFYLDVIGRIGNFAVTDTDDYRFSNFFKMPVSKMGALNMQDANNWLVEGVVEKVRDDIQNFYIGDTYDIRGNSASVETRWLDTYHTQSWMTGTFDPNTGERDINNPNLKSQILTGEANNIAVLKDEELRFGYDTYTSINTVGSYVSGNLQVIPKYYALKLTDNVGNDSYDKAKGTFVALDVYISKDGLYTPVNIFGNAANGKPNIQGLKLNDFAYNLDWTTESGRRNYTLEEKQRTQKLQDMLTIYDYGDVDLTGLEPEEIQAVLDQIEPEFNKLKIPYGKNNYMGSAQYMLLDGKHRTFIGTSESWGGNIYKSKAGTTDWGTDKNIRKVINNVYFEKAVQRWHGKLGVPSSSVFVPSGMAVNTNTIKYVMNEEWAIVCTAEIIAIGDVWSIAYSQPWFKTMEINNETYSTSQHYPGHRIYQGDDSVPCPNCIPPIIAVYSSESSSVDDVEIVQTH